MLCFIVFIFDFQISNYAVNFLLLLFLLVLPFLNNFLSFHVAAMSPKYIFGAHANEVLCLLFVQSAEGRKFLTEEEILSCAWIYKPPGEVCLAARKIIHALPVSE